MIQLVILNVKMLILERIRALSKHDHTLLYEYYYLIPSHPIPSHPILLHCTNQADRNTEVSGNSLIQSNKE